MDIIFVGKLILNTVLSLLILGVVAGVIFAVVYGYIRLRKVSENIGNKYLRFLARYGIYFLSVVAVIAFIIFLLSPARF